jgi:hypothetical protein
MVDNDRTEKYWQAAADCIEQARRAHAEETRVRLLALAQKWLDAASHRPAPHRFRLALEEFNDRQMQVQRRAGGAR